jgi:oxygen-independent coproporphyrinogen-3 oxidase
MQTIVPAVEFNADLLKKYSRPIPRYTSYPPAPQLTENFNVADFKWDLDQGNQAQLPLSLYFHIPFCESACYFCGCNVIVTQMKERAVEPYLDYLYRNIDSVASLIDSNRKVTQLHWGGGTPNYLNAEHTEALWKHVNRHFSFDDDAEISIEVNPRYINRDYIFLLRELGFNRISFGIQDFNPQVQAAINRIQPEELLFNVMSWIREAGFDSVNVDLIYGLPYQTLQTFSDTIQKTIKLDPDRIAVFNFAYVPWMKPVQKNIPQDALPSGREKLEIFHMTIDELQRRGYQFIGMDHFAKPDDELAVAQREGHLHRNFQGYTTKQDAELVGFGLTSIGMLHDVYTQNYKRLRDYYRAIDEQRLPIEKGVRLHRDDIIRRDIIMELMCHFRLYKGAIARKYSLDFDDYFNLEQPDLKILQADGLIELSGDEITVTPPGRLLIRNIASTFDSYLRDRQLANFSRAI